MMNSLQKPAAQIRSERDVRTKCKLMTVEMTPDGEIRTYNVAVLLRKYRERLEAERLQAEQHAADADDASQEKVEAI